MVESSNAMPEDYKTSVVGDAMQKFAALDGKQVGDPAKAVERIFEFVVGEGLAGELKGKVLRLVLGGDALMRMRRNNEKFVHDYTVGEKVALSTALDPDLKEFTWLS
jgi:hypothetical protein